MNIGSTAGVGLFVPINGNAVQPTPSSPNSNHFSKPDTATISIESKRTLQLEKLTTALLAALLLKPHSEDELKDKLAIDALLLMALAEACTGIEITCESGITTFSLTTDGITAAQGAIETGGALGMLSAGFTAGFMAGGLA